MVYAARRKTFEYTYPPHILLAAIKKIGEWVYSGVFVLTDY